MQIMITWCTNSRENEKEEKEMTRVNLSNTDVNFGTISLDFFAV